MNGEPEEENLNKSEISQVFEIALKRNLPVNFDVSVTLLLIYSKLCLQCVKVIAPRHFIIVCNSYCFKVCFTVSLISRF